MKAAITIIISLLCVWQNCQASVIKVPDNFASIQAAIDAANDGDTVKVANGEYEENLRFTNRGIVVIGNPEEREQVIINGGGNGPVVTFDRLGNSRSKLSGFLLMHGHGNTGGGVLINESSPTLEHLVISDNDADAGGGVFIFGECEPTLADIIFIWNRIESNGGNIAIWRARAILRDIVIIGDRENPGIMGGGVYISGGSAQIERILVSNCDASIGGAFSIWGSNVSIDKAIIVGNHAENGAVFYLSGGNVNLNHLTVGYNESNPGNASSIFSTGCNLEMINSIFLEDQNPQTDLIILHHGTVGIDYCDIIGGQEDIVNDQAEFTWGNHNFDAVPLFVDPDNGDFSLRADSPCIDTGSPDSPTDPDGSITDLGSIFFHQRDMKVEPVSIEFPHVEPDGFMSIPITVQNIGGTPLWLSIPQIFPDDGPFSWDWDQDPGQMMPGEESTLEIYYSPPDYGDYSGELWLISDDFHEDTLRIPLTARSLEVGKSDLQIAENSVLHPCHPNPFNATTNIAFSLARESDVSLRVFDLSGREVATLASTVMPVGNHSIIWSASNCNTGMYVVRLEVGGDVSCRKVLLVR